MAHRLFQRGGRPQLAVSSYEFKTLAFEAILDYVASLGVQAVELWPYNVAGLDLGAARDMLAARDMRVSCVSAGSTHRLNGEPTEAAQQAIFYSIELARALGASQVTTYLGSTPIRDVYTTLRLYARDLAPCLAEAARHGITILLENMFDHRAEDPHGTRLSRTPQGIRSLVEAVNSTGFGITFDPCNFHIAGVEPYPYAYDWLKDGIHNVHVKDATRYAEWLHGDLAQYPHWTDSQTGPWLSRPVGQGAVNFSGLIQRLCQDGYSGYLTVDIMTLPRDRDVAYRQSVDYIRQLMQVNFVD